MYPYITENNLENPQFYDYCTFSGVEFFKHYLDSRSVYKDIESSGAFSDDFIKKSVESSLDSNKSIKSSGDFSKSLLQEKLLDCALPIIKESMSNTHLAHLLIKTFEVNKRLYSEYGFTHSARENEPILRPNKQGNYHCLENYLAFGIVLIHHYKRTKNLIFLNTLLKLNDVLISLKTLSLSLSLCVRKNAFL